MSSVSGSGAKGNGEGSLGKGPSSGKLVSSGKVPSFLKAESSEEKRELKGLEGRDGVEKDSTGLEEERSEEDSSEQL